MQNNRNHIKLPLGINVATREPYKVYLVEDSVLFRTALKRTLARLNFDIAGEAANGLNALNYLMKAPIKPDIVCVDQEMPIMDGTTAIKEIKKLFPKMRIMLITSHNEGGFVKEVLQLGIHGYIVKPFEAETIIRKFSMLLGRKDILASFEDKIEKIDLSRIRIPNLPAVFSQVVAFDVENPENGIVDLERIISPDIGIASNLIRVANSAYYGRSGKIRNLREAISLIGLKMTKSMVVNEYNKALNVNLKEPVFTKHLRELPVLSSLVAFDLVKPLALKNLAEDIFTISLLRKIGMNILALNFKEPYLKVLKLAEFAVKSQYELERDEIGIDSIKMGLKVFEIWKMPELILKVVANQDFTELDIPNVSDLDRVTRLAELLAKKMLKINIMEKDNSMITVLLNHHKAPIETEDLFGEDYYQMIQDHPFLKIINVA